MAKVIVSGNFKGGVGKTTASCMLSYDLHKKGYKVLLIDFDPQANSTSFLTTSYNYELSGVTSIYEAMENDNLTKAIIHLDTDFDMLPSGIDLVGFKNLVTKKTRSQNRKPEMEDYFLTMMLSDIKDDYDYIIIDVPPTISEFTTNALLASDYTLIIMQTEPDSLLGAIGYHKYVQSLNDMVEDQTGVKDKIKTIGVLPYLEKKDSQIDKYTLEQSMSENIALKELIFDNHIYRRERVKRFRINGISNKDHHDKNVFQMYGAVTNELLEKVENDNG